MLSFGSITIETIGQGSYCPKPQCTTGAHDYRPCWSGRCRTSNSLWAKAAYGATASLGQRFLPASEVQQLSAAYTAAALVRCRVFEEAGVVDSVSLHGGSQETGK